VWKSNDAVWEWENDPKLHEIVLVFMSVLADVFGLNQRAFKFAAQKDHLGILEFWFQINTANSFWELNHLSWAQEFEGKY